MLFKPIFALAVLATVVNSRTLTLEELLKRAINNIGDPNDVPVTKVKEATGLAESIEDTSADDSVQRLKTLLEEGDQVEPQARDLADAVAGEIVEQIVPSKELKNIIVSLHNELRANVTPPATKMKKMRWNNKIAKYAADWAACGDNFFHHREGDNRVKDYGENLYISMSSATGAADVKEDIKNALMAWWNEKEHFNLADNSCESGKVCGHYTQMAWAKSNKIGCGYALNCPVDSDPRSFYLVCNYSPPGNYIDQKPYAAKTSTGPDISTFGGTSIGAKCLFPFEYHGESHSKCFEVYPGEMPWCKTRNGKWGYCAPEGTESTPPCKDSTSRCAYYREKMQGKCPTDTHYNNAKSYMEQRCKATCGYCSGCFDNPDPFDNHDKRFKCGYKWIKTNGLCRCPHWGPALTQECPITCGTCPNVGTDDRE